MTADLDRVTVRCDRCQLVRVFPSRGAAHRWASEHQRRHRELPCQRCVAAEESGLQMCDDCLEQAIAAGEIG